MKAALRILMRVLAYTAYLIPLACPAALTLVIPPIILQQPATAIFSVGDKVKLSVSAIGTLPFSYQWLKNGQALAGANASSYTIEEMAATDEGSYQVIVANAAGSAYSLPALLLLNRVPQILTQPLSQSVTPGTNVAFVVTVTGVPMPTLQWRHNGVDIPGATQATLLLTNVQTKDSGSYELIAVNGVGTAQSVESVLNILVPSLPFADNFVNRGIIHTAIGFGRGTNCGATLEPGEPKLARYGAPNSVWLSWWAPANGIATFSTLGSRFDTLLGVFRGSSVDTLTKVAIDDDSAGFHCSQVSFNAQAGTHYEVAVTGLGSACGDIVLNWTLIPTLELLPEILESPFDRTGNTNDIVALNVVFNAFEPTAIQWFYQGQILTNATQSTLTISNLHEGKVGGYSVRLTGASGRSVVSPSGDVQINTEGAEVSARNKFFDGFERALTR